MFLKLLLLFILLPMADLLLLLVVNRTIGFFPTVALVLTTGIVGAWLAKTQWGWLLQRTRSKISQSQVPTELVSDGAMLLLAAALLVTPGLITDAIGFSFLIPWCRKFYRSRLKSWFLKNVEVTTFSTGAQSNTEADIVEGHSRPHNTDSNHTPRSSQLPYNGDS
ncbi:MAG: FxsA family protein [Pirellulaceae bacterium]